MRVAEIYKSVQGEGRLTGAESAFVRTSGCNLRCWYCDTPYASHAPEGDDLAVEEILDRVDELDCQHVVLTGGEPMLFAELVPLTAALRRQRKHITIETAATLFLDLECDLMSLSPKLSGSGPRGNLEGRWKQRHERTRHQPQVVRQLIERYDYQVKFVIDTPDDLGEVERYLAELAEIDRARVMLMPCGTDVSTLRQHAEWLAPYCQQHGLQFCPRKQIEWYGLVRGT